MDSRFDLVCVTSCHTLCYQLDPLKTISLYVVDGCSVFGARGMRTTTKGGKHCHKLRASLCGAAWEVRFLTFFRLK